MAVSALEVRVAPDEERVGLGRFLAALEEVASALRDIDRAASPPGSSRPVWIVDDLNRQGLDFLVRLTARTTNGKRSAASLLQPIEAFVDGVRMLQEQPELPRFYTAQTVGRLLKIGEPGKGLRQVSVATVNGEVAPRVDLSQAVLEHARQAVREAEVSIGTVTGRLDILNGRARSGAVRLSLFDQSSRRAINGTAPAELADEMRNAWGHRVQVIGRITRNDRGQAVKIVADRLERLPDDNGERPSTDELLGADPAWTGGRTVDEYIREARRA